MTQNNNIIITLVGVKQAKENFIFLHQGGSEKCKKCEYYKICVEKLEVGRIYRIVKLHRKVFPCSIHEEGVRVVEVMESNVPAAIPANLAIEGAVITFLEHECNIEDCRYSEICFPIGLNEGDKCKVMEVLGKIPCPEKLPLVKVMLRRFSS